MSSSVFELDPLSAAALELQRDAAQPDQGSRVQPLVPARRAARRDALAIARPASVLPVQLAVRGTRSAGAEWLKRVGRLLERTLLRLLGPDAPIEPLLESALFEALSAWPPRSDQPMTLWGQRIAAGVALGHLKHAGQSPAPCARPARPGSLREVLSHLHGWLRAARPQEQLAFALLELNSSSVTDAAAIVRAAPCVVRQRAAFLRRQLLFAARSDLLLARYLRLGARLNTLLRRWDDLAAQPAASQRAQHLSAAAELELRWFL